MESRLANCLAENCSCIVENITRHEDPFFGRGLFFDFIPIQLLLNILVFVVLVLLLYWLVRGSKKPTETPLDMLKKRYVGGEIDEKTYLHMRKVISD